MKELLNLISESAPFKAAVSMLDDGACVQVEGLSASAKSVFTAALDVKGPTLLITYDYEQAERIRDDLTALGMSEDRLIVVPPSDSTAYQERDTDFDVFGRQMAALTALSESRKSLVIAPVSAALQRVIPPKVFSASRMRIEKGMELDPDDCLLKLVEMGYERADMVERKGEFSRRGGILDVFPSTAESPVRIELFGDEVESIRNFDLETQRSLGTINSLEIAPARDILIDGKTADEAADRIAELLGGRPDKLVEAVENDILKLRGGEYFDGIEYYLPLIYPEEFCLLDYLPANALVIVDEPHQVKSHFDELNEEIIETLAARVEKGEVLPIPGGHLLDLEKAAHRLRGKRCLLFSLLPRGSEWIEPDGSVQFPATPMDTFNARLNVMMDQFRTWLSGGCRVVLITAQPHRIIELIGENGLGTAPLSGLARDGSTGIFVIEGSFRSGFKTNELKLIVITDEDMFGHVRVHRPRKAWKKGLALSSLLDLSEGDYVVHINHGIGRYRGLINLSGAGGERDYLHIEYANPDKLYVPTDQLDRVQKYIGGDGQSVTLNRLGGTEWARTTRRVKKSVQDMARELIALYAVRQAQEGCAFSPDTPWQQELEAAFQYTETPDQAEAIRDVKGDLESPKPMDRLICGDVGYGKTEVAMRAVFKVVNDGKQAAVLAPTTILAQQHFNTFSERLAAYPVNVAMLSRFRSRAEQKKTVEGIRTGEVDVVIGTHRLLSKDIQFRDLGLLVVDEEQRFGVSHKERIKQLRKTVDVLTMTATPIPRTLHMSLSGIRDMSVIDDPPEGRIPIKTYCREYDDEMVRDAIFREIDRSGQVYFVHNRVENIEHIADHLRKLVPYAKIGVGHGQLSEEELERVMMEFYDHHYDVLLCTTIIENGLDIPNANTIIVNNSDKMGLAQLYQLRGRVGRSDRQAYAYLLYDPGRVMTEVAEKRLDAIREFTDLGSGMRIALRDLEIRGAGNLLGAEQSGQMSAVGFDMYCRLLSEAVQEAKGEEVIEFELPPVDMPVNAYIPTGYVKSEPLRLSFYKKMTAARDILEVDAIAAEFKDRFGNPPREVLNSLEILRLRFRASKANVASISGNKKQVVITFTESVRLAPDVAIRLKKKYVGCVFQAGRVLIDSRSPRLLRLVGDILGDLPAALEDSKALYFGMLD